MSTLFLIIFVNILCSCSYIYQNARLESIKIQKEAELVHLKQLIADANLNVPEEISLKTVPGMFSTEFLLYSGLGIIIVVIFVYFSLGGGSSTGALGDIGGFLEVGSGQDMEISLMTKVMTTGGVHEALRLIKQRMLSGNFDTILGRKKFYTAMNQDHIDQMVNITLHLNECSEKLLILQEAVRLTFH